MLVSSGQITSSYQNYNKLRNTWKNPPRKTGLQQIHLGDKISLHFYPNYRKLARKNSKKMTSKKSPSCHFGRHFQIKACWAPFLLIFSGNSWRFSDILPGFAPILRNFCPDFHHIKTLGVRLHPASYTGAQHSSDVKKSEIGI